MSGTFMYCEFQMKLYVVLKFCSFYILKGWCQTGRWIDFYGECCVYCTPFSSICLIRNCIAGIISKCMWSAVCGSEHACRWVPTFSPSNTQHIMLAKCCSVFFERFSVKVTFARKGISTFLAAFLYLHLLTLLMCVVVLCAAKEPPSSQKKSGRGEKEREHHHQVPSWGKQHSTAHSLHCLSLSLHPSFLSSS